MPDPRLFREEALAALERGDQDGDVVRISPRWTAWLYWLLLAVAAAALLFGFLATVREHVEGNAFVVGDEVVAYFGGNDRRRVEPGMTLRLLDDGVEVRVASVSEEGALIVARAPAPAGVHGGSVDVTLRERPILAALFGTHDGR
jgi:hypothetical protein